MRVAFQWLLLPLALFVQIFLFFHFDFGHNNSIENEVLRSVPSQPCEVVKPVGVEPGANQDDKKVEGRITRTDKTVYSTTKQADQASSLPRIMAIYFPQYHKDPINDKNWGDNFTDWNSLKSSAPKNRLGYPIPRPTELGYYDLNDVQVRKRQGELAKSHSIDGFIYHHYWFYDKSHPGANLAQPLLNMLKDGHPAMPFFFNWCTVTWINVWMGKAIFQTKATTRKEAIVLQQQYFRPSLEEIKQHYDWLSPFFHHPNYIKIDNQPIFFTYSFFPEQVNILESLRKFAIEDGFDGLHLVVGRGAMPDHIYKPKDLDDELARTLMDSASLKAIGMDDDHFNRSVYNQSMTYPYPLKYVTKPYTVPQWCLQGARRPPINKPQYGNKRRRPEMTGVLTTFDNSPRRPNDEASIYNEGTPEQVLTRFRQNLFVAMFSQACCVTGSYESLDDRFVAINAWNEWGEGMSLEPSDVYGKGFLEVIQEVKAAVAEAQCDPRKIPEQAKGSIDDQDISGDEIRANYRHEYGLREAVSEDIREFLAKRENQTDAPSRAALLEELLKTVDNSENATKDDQRRYFIVNAWLQKSKSKQ